MNRKAAFTLIELLVVIAIIAILAAILFPVFAQAKAAAKGAKTLSNIKQNLTSTAIYQGDYDDTFYPAGTMNGNGASWGSGACSDALGGCPSWERLLFPYTKNLEIFTSDFDRTPAQLNFRLGSYKRSFRVAANVVRGWAGYTTWGAGDIGYTATNATSIPSPANTILFTEQRNAAYLTDWYPNAGMWENSVWYSQSANTLANTDPVAYGTEPNAAWRYVSGIDYANAEKAVFGFSDGHAKVHAKGYIFPGYQQRKDKSSPVNTALKGVCLDADGISPQPGDCTLPQ